jgi:hypothetical protein
LPLTDNFKDGQLKELDVSMKFMIQLIKNAKQIWKKFEEKFFLYCIDAKDSKSKKAKKKKNIVHKVCRHDIWDITVDTENQGVFG